MIYYYYLYRFVLLISLADASFGQREAGTLFEGNAVCANQTLRCKHGYDRVSNGDHGEICVALQKQTKKGPWAAYGECLKEWTNLVQITTPELNTYIKGILGSKKNSNSLWISVTPAMMAKTTFHDWAHGEPARQKYPKGSQLCAVIEWTGWKIIDCAQSRLFVCAYRPDGYTHLYPPKAQTTHQLPKLALSLNPSGQKQRKKSTIQATCSVTRYQPVKLEIWLLTWDIKVLSLKETIIKESVELVIGQTPQPCEYRSTTVVSFQITDRMNRGRIGCTPTDLEGGLVFCTHDFHDCATGSILKVHNKPALGGTYSRAPNTAFVGQPLNITCSTFDSALDMNIFPNLKKNEYRLVSYRNPKTKELTKTMSVTSMKKSSDGSKVICFARPTTAWNTFWDCGMTARCSETTISVLYGPEPPVLNVTYDTPPSTSRAGQPLLAVCQANVGEEDGHLMWVMVIGGEVTFPRNDTEKSGVDIDDFEILGDEGTIIESKLTLHEITEAHDGLVLICLSHNQFPRGALACGANDDLCVQSAALNVVDGKFSFKDAVRVLVIIALVVLALLTAAICLGLTHRCISKEPKPKPEAETIEAFLEEEEKKLSKASSRRSSRSYKSMLSGSGVGGPASVAGTAVDSARSGITVLHEEVDKYGNVIIVAETEFN